MSCHNAAGSASAVPFSNADKAILGSGGTSHTWDEPAVNSTYETLAPTDSEMALRLPGNQIICSTCHDNAHPSGISYPTVSSNLGTFSGQIRGTGWDKSDYPGSAHDTRFTDTGDDCQRCHENHGSTNYSLLLGTYLNTDRESGTYSGSDFTSCFTTGCHGGDRPSNNTFGDHRTHVWDMEFTCIHCHDVHSSAELKLSGTPEAGLIDLHWGFNWCTEVYDYTEGRNRQTSFTPGYCFIQCHNENHNPENY